jgi:hypothetical protein
MRKPQIFILKGLQMIDGMSHVKQRALRRAILDVP